MPECSNREKNFSNRCRYHLNCPPLLKYHHDKENGRCCCRWSLIGRKMVPAILFVVAAPSTTNQIVVTYYYWFLLLLLVVVSVSCVFPFLPSFSRHSNSIHNWSKGNSTKLWKRLLWLLYSIWNPRLTDRVMSMVYLRKYGSCCSD